MPKQPKTITQRTKVILHMTSGKAIEYRPRSVEQFMNDLEKNIEHGYVINAVEGNKQTTFNTRCIEYVEVVGAAVVTKAYKKTV